MDWLERVKRLKSEKKMTNDMLSSSTGISVGTLNKLLAGQTESPKLSVLKSLAAALGVSIAYLSGETEDRENVAVRMDALDGKGRDAVLTVLKSEEARVEKEKAASRAQKISAVFTDEEKYRPIKLYATPVSAGLGSFLDCPEHTLINLPVAAETSCVDFAVKVSGDSMEPKYLDGDIVLVQSMSEIPVDSIGIFLYNGESYIKRRGDGRLHSANPKYSDIVFSGDDSIRCLGKVVAKVKR